jgi:hypothetical protein
VQTDPYPRANRHPGGHLRRYPVVELAIDGGKVGEDPDDSLAALYSPNSCLKASSRVVCSQVNSFSGRPKCPYAAVRR